MCPPLSLHLPIFFSFYISTDLYLLREVNFPLLRWARQLSSATCRWIRSVWFLLSPFHRLSLSLGEPDSSESIYPSAFPKLYIYNALEPVCYIANHNQHIFNESIYLSREPDFRLVLDQVCSSPSRGGGINIAICSCVEVICHALRLYLRYILLFASLIDWLFELLTHSLTHSLTLRFSFYLPDWARTRWGRQCNSWAASAAGSGE